VSKMNAVELSSRRRANTSESGAKDEAQGSEGWWTKTNLKFAGGGPSDFHRLRKISGAGAGGVGFGCDT